MGDIYAACLQVKLLHHQLHILLEGYHALVHLRVHQFEVRACHAHLSASLAPVEDGEAQAHAHILFVEQVVVAVAQVVARLRQAQLHVYIRFQSRVGLGIGQVALALQALTLHILYVGVVLDGQRHGFGYRHHELRHAVVGHHGEVCTVLDVQVAAQVVGSVVHRYLCAQYVGLLIELAHLELQQLVLGDGAYVVTTQGEAVERVGCRLIGLRYLQVGLRRGKAEEVVGRLCRHQLHGLGILLACLAEAHRLDAAVPLQRVVAEEVLLVGEVERLHIVGRILRAQEVETACRAAQLEGTAREPHVLRHIEREVRLHIVLSYIRHRAVGRSHIVRRAVQVGVALQ